MRIPVRVLLLVIAVLAVSWIATDSRSASVAAGTNSAALPVGKPITIKAPLGLPPVPVPRENPLTADTVALGRRLLLRPAAFR